MRLCNKDSQTNCFTFSHLYVVVQLVWIAAFLVSTKLERFRCQPPGEISYCCFGVFGPGGDSHCGPGKISQM